MKQTLLLAFFVLFGASALLAQPLCQPDPIYQDSSAGVYPNGLDACAVIGEPLNITLTAVVRDTIVFAGIPLPLDSIAVLNINGAPEGLNFSCNPPNCVFVANTMGCATLSGTPTSSNQLGNYSLTIDVIIYVQGSPPIPLTLPNPQFPAEFNIELLEAGSPCNFVSTEDRFARQVEVKALPNPAVYSTTLHVESEYAGESELVVRNLIGQVVHRQPLRLQSGTNRFELETSSWPNGLYLYTLQSPIGSVTKRLVVQHYQP